MLDPARLINQVLNGTYRIQRVIGEGGMGAVYEALHEQEDRRYALKLLSPQSGAPSADAIARFWREAEVTSRLRHPHIVECVDFNKTREGMLYIVMELLEGEDLADRLARVSRLDLLQTATILKQATSALQFAHDQGVIHRDLKPSNTFLCLRAGGEVVKIVDFGLSKVVSAHSDLTKSNVIIGTPYYMSPEQLRGPGSEVSARSDVFSMGAILFEMLAGESPHYDDNIFKAIHRLVNEEPPSLCSFGADVPVAVEQVVRKALSKQPQDRHGSMRELWQAYSAALGSDAMALQDATLEWPPAGSTAGAGDRTPPDQGDRTPVDTGDRTPTDPGDRTSVEPGDRTSVDTGDRTPVDTGDRTPSDPGDRTSVDTRDRTPSEPGLWVEVQTVLDTAPRWPVIGTPTPMIERPQEGATPTPEIVLAPPPEAATPTPEVVLDRAMQGATPTPEVVLERTREEGPWVNVRTRRDDGWTEAPAPGAETKEQRDPFAAARTSHWISAPAAEETHILMAAPEPESELPPTDVVAAQPSTTAKAPAAKAPTVVIPRARHRTTSRGRRLRAVVLVAAAAVLSIAGVLIGLSIGEDVPDTPGPGLTTPDTVAPPHDAAAPLFDSAAPDAACPGRDARKAVRTRPRRPKKPPPARVEIATRSRTQPISATIYLDGTWIGETPLHLKRVKPGRHVVEARRKGYKKRSTKVWLAPGKLHSLILELEEQR